MSLSRLASRLKAEEAERELLRQSGQKFAALTAEGRADEVAPGHAVLVGDAHTLRVVDQNPDEISLGNDRSEYERRLEKYEDQDRDQTEP